jgi:hypothetical protein
MMERMGGKDPCAFFGQCRGHFNAEGYRMLAEIVAVEIRRTGMLRVH